MFSFACKGSEIFGISKRTKSVLNGKKQVKMDKNDEKKKGVFSCIIDIYILLISHFFTVMYWLWVLLKTPIF